MSRDATWTPIKVRGKRRGQPEEKLRSHKVRDPVPRSWRTTLQGPSDVTQPVSHTCSRGQLKRHENVHLVPLELLPVELLHLIFELSSNLNLPLASRTLAVALSDSQHLQLRLVSRLLSPVLGESHLEATATDITNATRLLDSRFMTWAKFTEWLLRQQLKQYMQAVDGAKNVEALSRLWSMLRPCLRLPPPQKLLRPPFTRDKIKFLDLLTRHVDDFSFFSPFYHELARDGLLQAISRGATEAVPLFFRMGMKSDTEMLRVAVQNTKCEIGVIEMILIHPGDVDSLDLLDIELHNLMDRAESGRGGALKELIATAQRHREIADP
ncbi:uncharacterized protein K489DRAFT_376026 [Dissoconium aciculare CBS 342.82]|uniref:Uncharacterized protein n=1 Tax=Dissoconium aciculare CBS 342.82 TaxID=1314786 RepID=A0A6J3MIX2_9PEZI|nr:uncharacterized protein K489DRAFT_376026 [Dissoconium aciculare CBS 342.82]KAF1827866.1 hypothetical protein K489DRAFT_376026 [Dissoconium aciculare CBS 342.82]